MSGASEDGAMTTRRRPADLGFEDANRFYTDAAEELRTARIGLGMTAERAARRARMSPSQYSRVEREGLDHPSLDQLCRAARAVGLEASFRLHPSNARIRDRGQQPLLARFEVVLRPPARLRREVGLPIPGDMRAWDGRVVAGQDAASIDAEARLEDIQAVARRIALKQRDDPDAGIVILLLARTTHNRRVLAENRESLRVQFPLDGAAIMRHLRAGRLPPASGILML
jgi:transcriptional regulator with XRE-family HTH domain